jgi:hypothetical protein
MTAPFRLAFFADPRPIVVEPGPDQLLITFLGSDSGDLWSPTRRPEPSGQVIGVVADAEVVSDHLSDPFQSPAVGFESCLQSALAENPQNTAPLRGGQTRRTSSPGPAPKSPQPGRGVTAQLLGPMLNGPEADTQSLGDFGVGQSSGSEQSSSFQPTFFDLAWSQFARTPHDGDHAKPRAEGEAIHLRISRLPNRTRGIGGCFATNG